MNPIRQARRWLIGRLLGMPGTLRVLMLSVVVGVAAGVGAIVFYTMLDAAKSVCLDGIAGYRPQPPGGEPPLFPETATPFRRWVLLLLPAAGGLLSGWVVYRFAPEAEGHGTDAAIEAYHRKGGQVRARVPIVKAISAALTIGTGGSAGREGPIAQIASGFGSTLARWLELEPRERRILLAAGMAAGVGAIFRAPMAGALFAAEVLYRDLDLEYEILIPSIIASVIAYAVFTSQFGWNPLFVTPDFTFRNPLELVPYLLLAFLLAGGAIAYIKCFYGVHRLFARLRMPNWLKPAAGGLAVGAIGFILPQALCTGYGPIQSALVHGTALQDRFGSIGAGLLVAIVAGKILTTAFTVGSGGSGGVFGPAIAIGGAIGGAFGMLVEHVVPGLGIQPGAFVIVGMAGFFGAAAKTPISTIIMVSEMTGNYHLLVPSMWVCIIAYMLCYRHTLYVKQIRSRFYAPGHQRNMIEAILQNMTVADVLSRLPIPVPVPVPAAEPLPALLERFSRSEQTLFPVTGADGELTGMVTQRELRAAIAGGDMMHQSMIAADLAVPPVTARPSEPLSRAVRRMTDARMENLLVTDETDPRRIVAVLSQQDIMSVYDKEARQ